MTWKQTVRTGNLDMRRGGVFCLSLVVLSILGLLSGDVLATEPSGEWVLVKVTAGASGLSLENVDISVEGHARGSGPVILGWAVNSPQRERPFFKVHDLGWGEGYVGATTDIENVTLKLTPASRGAFDFGVVVGGDLAAGEWLAILLFATHAALGEPRIEGDAPSSDEGHVAVEMGGTSHVIRILAPEQPVLGLAVGPIGMAYHDRTFSADAGLVGGFRSSCSACYAHWESPDDRQGTVIKTPAFDGTVFIGSESFAGPAGEWRLATGGIIAQSEANGSHLASPTFGAYATIGEHWMLFKPRSTE